MRNFVPLLALGTLLSTPAWAIDACTPTKEDIQTRVCDYNPLQRYSVNGLVGHPINLSFGPNETIKRSEFAYTGVDDKGNPSATWRGPRCGEGEQKCSKDQFINNTPIWPYATGHSSLIIVTVINGAERPYRFDLTARNVATDCLPDTKPGCPGDETTTTALSFTYSTDQAAAKAKDIEDKKQVAISEWRVKQSKHNEQVALARLTVDPLYGPQNPAYRAFGDKAKYGYLAPSVVTDNGWLTEFQWPGNLEVPSITIVNNHFTPQETELAVIPNIQGSMHVINRTAEWFRLRLGRDAVIDIQNKAFKADRVDPHTGTPSPDVVRTVIYGDGGTGR